LGLEEHVKRFKKLLDYYGYPDWYINYLTKLEKELYIEVTDRFGTSAGYRCPRSTTGRAPSPRSRVWAIHDVFGAGRAGFEEYFKWAERMGVPRDIAILQYISRFKYPPPRRLDLRHPSARWSRMVHAQRGRYGDEQSRSRVHRR